MRRDEDVRAVVYDHWDCGIDLAKSSLARVGSGGRDQSAGEAAGKTQGKLILPKLN